MQKLATLRDHRRFISYAAAAVLTLTLFAVSSTASQASADDRISGVVPIEVTAIEGTVPLVIGGTVVILNEEAVSTAPVTTFGFVEGFESLDLHFRQSSVEQFTSTDFAVARSTSGDANGTITAMNSATGQKVATGSYKLSMSTTDDCQMKGNGTWSMTSDKFTVTGEVSTCVNWDASIENFTGFVNVDGDLVMKEEPAPRSGGLLKRTIGGLFR